MRVRSHKRSDLPVEKPPHRNLFRSRFCMKIYNGWDALPLQRYELFHRTKRADQRVHEGASFYVCHIKLPAIFRQKGIAETGHPLRVIKGANHPGLPHQVGDDFLLFPDVVARCNAVDTGCEHLFGQAWRYTKAACEVLTVDDFEVRMSPLEIPDSSFPARLPDDITYENNDKGIIWHNLRLSFPG